MHGNEPFLILGIQSMEMSIRDTKKSSLSGIAMPSVALHDNYTRGIDISQGKEPFIEKFYCLLLYQQLFLCDFCHFRVLICKQSLTVKMKRG